MEQGQEALKLAADIAKRVSRILNDAATAGQEFEARIHAGVRKGPVIPGQEDCTNPQHDGSFDIHITVKPLKVVAKHRCTRDLEGRAGLGAPILNAG
jgi:hypothetical protein